MTNIDNIFKMNSTNPILFSGVIGIEKKLPFTFDKNTFKPGATVIPKIRTILSMAVALVI